MLTQGAHSFDAMNAMDRELVKSLWKHKFKDLIDAPMAYVNAQARVAGFTDTQTGDTMESEPVQPLAFSPSLPPILPMLGNGTLRPISPPSHIHTQRDPL